MTWWGGMLIGMAIMVVVGLILIVAYGAALWRNT